MEDAAASANKSSVKPTKFGHGTAYLLSSDNELSEILWCKYNSLMDAEDHNRRFLGEIPASLMRENIPRLFDGRWQYVCCEKTHGERYHLFMTVVQTSRGRFTIQACLGRDSLWRLVSIPAPVDLFRDTLIDGEQVEEVDKATGKGTGKYYYVLFTAMAYKGTSVHSCDFLKRYSAKMDFLKRLKFAQEEQKRRGDHSDLELPFWILAKGWYPMSKFRHLVEEVRPNLPYNSDGFMFTPVCMGIHKGHHPMMLKLKDLTDNTVDFKLHLVEGDPNLIRHPWVEPKTRLEVHSGRVVVELWCTRQLGVNDYEEMLYTMSYITREDIVRMGLSSYSDINGKIVECRINLETCLWKPESVRNKIYPNILATVEKTCKNIEENIRPEELYE